MLSILLFFRRNWWPEGEVLGHVRELDGWHSMDRYPEAEETDGIVVYRWEAPLFFANAGIFRQEIRKLVHRREPRWVVLQCEAITDIDVTAADMLVRLDKELNAKGVNVVFVEMRGRIEDLLERYGLFSTLTREHVYPSIDMALRGIERGGGGTTPRPSKPLSSRRRCSTTRPRHSGSVSRSKPGRSAQGDAPELTQTLPPSDRPCGR